MKKIHSVFVVLPVFIILLLSIALSSHQIVLGKGENPALKKPVPPKTPEDVKKQKKAQHPHKNLKEHQKCADCHQDS